MDEVHGPAPEQPGEALTSADWTAGVDVEQGASLTAQLSNAMVGLKKHFYGKGPTRCKTFICQNYIFSVLEDGLLPHEEVLLEAGEPRQVRENRLAFQEAMAKPTMDAVEQLTRRRVLTYHSQIVFDPVRTFEIFVLDEEP
jgi:uncharacterized protein YbcI